MQKPPKNTHKHKWSAEKALHTLQQKFPQVNLPAITLDSSSVCFAGVSERKLSCVCMSVYVFVCLFNWHLCWFRDFNLWAAGLAIGLTHINSSCRIADY